MKNKIKFIISFIFVMFLTITNTVKAVEELHDNGAKISSVQVIQTKTGTGPFDDNDEPGNDSSEDNNIVRSFDQVTWTIENTMVVTGEESSFCGGKIFFEATFPDTLNSETAEWNLDAMAWIEDAKLSDDKRTISGYYSMNTENITIPGKQSLVFVLNIYGAANETEFQPSFKMWLNGNEESNYTYVEVDKIAVSAAPKYNVKLTRNNSCAIRTTVNIDGESVTGRMYGYSLIYQLYNDSVSKGLKGVEYPTGDIDLDLQMLFTKKESNSSIQTDITSEITPILWNYQLAIAGANKTMIPGRSMFTGSSAFVYNGDRLMPAGKATSNRNSSVYNSGNISIVQEGTVLKTKLKNYKFDGTFPSYNSGYVVGSAKTYLDNIGCFGSIYLQILVPDWDQYDSETDYYFGLKDINFNATSISGLVTTSQMNTKDDSTSVQYTKLLPGTYNSLVYIHKRLNDTSAGAVHTLWSAGDGRVQKGQELILRAEIEQSVNNDDEVHMRTVNDFMKFDADCYQPVLLGNGNKFKPCNAKMTFKMWYVTKKDGTNWISQSEMNTTLIEDCILYENLEDIPENYLCVGVYYESQGGVLPDRDFYIDLPVVIKDTAVIGKTYAVTQTPIYWIYELDRSIYTALNEDVERPEDSVYHPIRDYVKTEYDSSGTQISGTHAGGTHYGNTVQVVGANQSIKLSTIDKSTNTGKINYDISKNEYDVTYKIEPNLSSTNQNISDVTVQITLTLPTGITYVPVSCNIGEPEVATNSDGSSTLIWNLNGCTVNQAIEPILFDAHIDENTLNGVQYEAKVVMLADSSKVGTSLAENRTATTSIQIVNLSSHRLYKTVETPVIEKDGTIHYTLSYKNNTEDIINNFQLLDILPYNGDNRGTDYTGTYLLDRLVVTQEDESGNTLTDDNLELFYTDDESVRENVTSKDENLGDTWTKINTENIMKSATAFAVKGNIGKQGKLNIDIYLKTNNNNSLDKYINSASAQVYPETEEMITGNVTAQVVKRKIEGIAWEDINANGTKDENEQIFKNIEVTLTDDQGNQVTDINGNIVGSVRTDENGYYKFENLPRENYYVKVSLPNSKYQLTEKGVGSNIEINSKFDIEARETDEITKLNSIDLPELTVSNVNAGFVKKATKVVVNYREIGNEDVPLLDQLTIDGRIDDPYNTENRMDEINEKYQNKYEYVRVEGSTDGTMTEDTIYITYWYQKKATKVKVLHVLEGTDVSKPEEVTEVLYPTEEKTGRVDDSYTTQNRIDEINQKSEIEYELVTDEVLNKTGNMKVDTIYVIYEYRTIPARIKVNHLEKDTDTVLYNQEVKDGLVGENYRTTNRLNEINKEFENKFELVTPEPENKNGKYKKEEQEVTYYYQKKMAEVEVNYLEVGTEKILADQELLQDRVDSKYNTINKLDEINETFENKYEFVETTGDATEGIYKLDKQVVNYYYQKKATNVKVLHVLEGTDVSNPENITEVLYPTEEKIGRVDDSYTTQNRLSEINRESKEQYDLVTDEVKNKAGNMELNTIYVVYEYRKAPSTIKIEHRDVDTYEDLLPVITENGIVGEEYKTNNKLTKINEEFENKYELVIPEPENKDGEYRREEQIITYYYSKKPSKVIVKYVDIDTGKELINGEEIKGKVDSPYETVDKIEEINETNINKYVLEKTTENTDGNMTLETIEVVYYYKKVEAQVIVKHIDEETGEEIAEKEYLGGYVGDKYTTKEKEIEGYRLVEKKIPVNKDGMMTEEIIEVIYYYNKIPEVTNINTGDIAVYAIVTLAVACVIGIVFVVIRNRKNK